MVHLDLFSGIGGFALAASWVWGEDHHIHSFVEIDPFCQKVLKKHWPDVPIHSDIKDYKHNGTAIDLITGGFPCQPFSCAGKQGGKEDDRYLWPEMLRVIREIRPTWIIGENVAGIINMELDGVLSDLESASYEVQSFLIPACAVDAPHRRDRVWIVAHSNGERQNGKRICIRKRQEEIYETSRRSQDVADTIDRRVQWGEKTGNNQENRTQPVNEHPSGLCRSNRSRTKETTLWLPEPDVGRVANGVSNRVDRLKSLGNAIVPQVVVPIMQAIREIDNNFKTEV